MEIDDELKFKRYLYFLTENQHAVVKRINEYGYDLLVTSLTNLVAEEKYKNIMDIIEAANDDKCLPDRNILFFILTHCTRLHENIELQALAYKTIMKILKNTQEFFLFLKYDHDFHKNLSSGGKKVVRNFYLKAEPSELYSIISNQNSYYGWTHHDVLRVGHLKTDNLMQSVLLGYVCKDLENAKKKIGDNKQLTPEIEDMVKKLEDLEKFKHCHDENVAVNLIKEHHFSVNQLPSKFLRSQMIWETLIPQMEIPDLLKELNRFHKIGFFKGNNPIVAKVVEVLTDAEKCKKCNIYPTDVLIEMKTFERGKPMDPNLKAYLDTLQPQDKPVTKKVDASTQTTTILNSKEKPESTSSRNNVITNAFTKLLHSSFRNPVVTGRRIMITIENRQPALLKYTFGTKTVTCLEAVSILTMSILRVEKDVTVATFNGDNVNIVQLSKGMTYNQICQTIKASTSSYVILSKPFQWATEKNKHIDIFINILYTGDAPTRIPKEVKETLTKEGKDNNVLMDFKKYKSKMKLINTKLLHISLAGRSLNIADGSKGILDITGFNSHVPKMLEAFCNDSVI